jgi:hypothetical protein
MALRFDEWYYGGPYLRVENPDADLPRRNPSVPLSANFVERTEFDGQIRGERLVAPFHDGNTAGEILGELSFAGDYPNGWDDEERYVYPTIQGMLAIIALRIETKLRRKPGKARADQFALALEHVRSGATLFTAGSYDAAQDQLRIAYDVVQSAKPKKKRVPILLGGTDSNETES